jgi:hypothetical protein
VSRTVKSFYNAGNGQVVACPPIFDWDYYTSTYADAAKMDSAAALHHFNTVGILEGRRCHAGPKIFKILVMTMNEWPLIRSWTLYHASIFGGENLYILDSRLVYKYCALGFMCVHAELCSSCSFAGTQWD